MMHGTIVKKGTASCDKVHGSSRAKIKVETNMSKDSATISDIGSTKR